ncbi:MAG: gamma-glutamylcyclotransferase [Cyclobacteriaceae bacterium]
MEYLFVYGWLKSEYRKLHSFTPNIPVRSVGIASIQGELFHIAGYPGVKLHGSGTITGELLLIDKPLLWTTLDQFELSTPTVHNHPEYRRVRTKANWNNHQLNCWVYEYTKPAKWIKRIRTGVF